VETLTANYDHVNGVSTTNSIDVDRVSPQNRSMVESNLVILAIISIDKPSRHVILCHRRSESSIDSWTANEMSIAGNKLINYIARFP